MAGRADVELHNATCVALGRAACGVPRAARQLVLAARELVAVGEKPTIDGVLEHCEVSPDGLTRDHVAYLGCLSDLGGQAGLEVLGVRLQLRMGGPVGCRSTTAGIDPYLPTSPTPPRDPSS